MLASRLILIGAAAIATISVGVATLKPKSEPAPTAQQGGEPSLPQMIAAIEARVKAAPDDAEAWRMLGTSFSEAGRFGEAATAFKRTTQLVPDKAESWSNYGEALVLAGQGNVAPDAKAAFTTALARDAKDVRARYFLAVAKDISGDHSGAIDDWFALLMDSPADAPWQSDVRGLIQQVATKQKIDVKARLAALPAPPVGPNSAQGQAIKDLPADQQNAMIASMVGGLAQRLEGNPKGVEGWTMLMRSYAALDRKDDAKAALSKALKANPDAAASLNESAAQLGIQ
jgi:cytochrome c-type biogenesis protein CcmH